MKDTKDQFFPTLSLRVLAAFNATLLISGLSLNCILSAAFLGPALSHGTHVDHAAGQIVSIGSGKHFVLLTATGHRLSFQCETQCRALLEHLPRHLKAHAHTDVSSTQGVNKEFLALDADEKTMGFDA